MDAATSTAIACVHVAHELRYVAQAAHYNGYLVQQRYYGLGTPRYCRAHGSVATGHGPLWKTYSQYQAYWHPFLNPAAVRLAGFAHAEVMAWAQAHPDAIFTHPTFASLCLRWGRNAHGATVTRLDTAGPAGHLPPLYFTPHTCWVSGNTYFQLAPILCEEDPLVLALQEQAGLALHAYPHGEEGAWQGWYTTDRLATEDALRTLGYSFALDQRHRHYFVNVYPAPGQQEGMAYYGSVNEAKAHFAQLPARVSAKQEPFYPRANRGFIETLGGQVVGGGIAEDKLLDTGLYRGPSSLAATVARGYADPSQPVFVQDDFTSTHYPFGEEVPTLSSLLAATGNSRRRLAEMLRRDEQVVCDWERAPGNLTLRDLIDVADLLNMPPAQLTTLLHDELMSKGT